jgi:hypothetical protein
VNGEGTGSKDPDSNSANLQRADSDNLVVSAIDYIRGILSTSGEASGTPTVAWQKKSLCEWARSLGLLLKPDLIVPRLERGGQEHDIFRDGERVIKVTRYGVFGLSPGIELALVASSVDARRFHLWEATPLDYLERLLLHNQLVPGLNQLEGVLAQADGDLAIVTSQPRFDILPVSQAEIDAWFASLGFQRITSAGYYREQDNLGIFDAHDRNVIRAEGTLVPFDIIPCHPAGGFLRFIADILSAGHSIEAVRTVKTDEK